MTTVTGFDILLPEECWTSVIDNIFPTHEQLKSELLASNDMTEVLRQHHMQLCDLRRLSKKINEAVKQSDAFVFSLVLGPRIRTPRFSKSRRRKLVLAIIIVADTYSKRFNIALRKQLPLMSELLYIESTTCMNGDNWDRINAVQYFRTGFKQLFETERPPLRFLKWTDPGSMLDLIRLSPTGNNLTVLSFTDRGTSTNSEFISEWPCLRSVTARARWPPSQYTLIGRLMRDRKPSLEELEFKGAALRTMLFNFCHTSAKTIRVLKLGESSANSESRLPSMQQLHTLQCNVTALEGLLLFQQTSLRNIYLLGLDSVTFSNSRARSLALNSLCDNVHYVLDLARAPSLRTLTLSDLSKAQLRDTPLSFMQAQALSDIRDRLAETEIDFNHINGDNVFELEEEQ